MKPENLFRDFPARISRRTLRPTSGPPCWKLPRRSECGSVPAPSRERSSRCCRPSTHSRAPCALPRALPRRLPKTSRSRALGTERPQLGSAAAYDRGTYPHPRRSTSPLAPWTSRCGADTGSGSWNQPCYHLSIVECFARHHALHISTGARYGVTATTNQRFLP